MDKHTEVLERLNQGIERIESMLHRALHGSEPDTAGIYKRLDRVEVDISKGKGALKWLGGIVGALGLTFITRWLWGSDG